MKEIVPAPPAIVRNDHESIRELFTKNVVPSYGRFELVLSHGTGSHVFDVGGKRYLDLGSGIAVCCLGHAHPAITEALVEQSKKLIHVSNLYFTEPQGRLAAELVKRIGPGKVFFGNSGAEANEGLYKLARKFGHDEGRVRVAETVHGNAAAEVKIAPARGIKNVTARAVVEDEVKAAIAGHDIFGEQFTDGGGVAGPGRHRLGNNFFHYPENIYHQDAADTKKMLWHGWLRQRRKTRRAGIFVE